MSATPRTVAAKNLKVGHNIAWTANTHVTVSRVEVDEEANTVLAYYGGYVPADFTLNERVGLHWEK